MKKITVCRLCSACCPIEVEVSEGVLIGARRITAFERVITCPKLQNAKSIVYSKERILKPLLRDSLKEDFKEVSWQEALNFIAEKTQSIVEKNGPQSVALLRGMAADWGTPWDYAVRLMSALGSPNALGNGSVCFVAREMAHTYTYGAMTIPQVKDSKCIVIWGKNDRNTAPTMAEGIIYAKDKGAKLIVIDPVKTFFADMADIWLRVKPGHDGILAMAMIKVILEEGLFDREFVFKWCLGLDKLESVISKLNLEDASLKTGVPLDLIQKTAREYATSKPACIIDGNGLDMQLDVFNTTRCVSILRALTGNIDIVGGDFLPQPIPLRNIQLKDKVSNVPSVMQNYPLFERFHPTWGLHGQSSLIDSIIDEKPYPVKMLFVQSGNPVVTMMDSNRVKKAFQKLDCVVMIDPFMNKTSHFANVILPACTCFEKTQINRAYIRHCFIMLQHKVIEPLGESKSDIEIVFEIARALGLNDYFPWNSVEEALDYQLEPTGLTIDALKENPSGIWYERPKERKFIEKGFKTPSQKVEIFSERLSQAGYDPVPYSSGFPQNLIGFAKENLSFIGISGERVTPYTHTQFRRIEELRKLDREPYVDINFEDAARLEIKREDLVRVSTPKGSIEMKARLTDLIPSGVIRIAWGWGEESELWNLNAITDDLERDPVTCTPPGRSFCCSVEKVDK